MKKISTRWKVVIFFAVMAVPFAAWALLGNADIVTFILATNKEFIATFAVMVAFAVVFSNETYKEKFISLIPAALAILGMALVKSKGIYSPSYENYWSIFKIPGIIMLITAVIDFILQKRFED